MKRLPISIQTFEKIRTEDYLYVDKTEYVHRLVNQGTYYFLARPRRFGKSLLLSTLKAYFQGKKELFEGLYIYEKEKEWKIYPVIHIDYSKINYRDGKAIFTLTMLAHLQTNADIYGIQLIQPEISAAFNELVLALYKQFNKQVVVLVDEYDKPLVDSLNNPVQFEENRAILNNLYGTMKGNDQYLRFVLLTGVSRFAKVGIFSGMNNPDDISMNTTYSTIVGFTQEELEAYFEDHIDQLIAHFSTTREILLPKIKEWYNGFSFDGVHKLYNPFSVLKLFIEQNFSNYWFSTGTPSFLIQLIKEQKQLPETFEQIKVTDLIGNSINLKRFPLIPLLYQTGYLAIESAGLDDFQTYYYLNYPNKEVQHSFLTYITAAFLDKSEAEIQPEAFAIRDALIAENMALFTQKLQSFFSDIPGRLHIPREAYYHSLTYLILRLVGAKALLEKETDKGRIDAVLELPDKIYIIEFKFATDKRVKQAATLSKNALKQVKDNKYYEPYLSIGKRVLLLGLGFLNKEVSGKMVELKSN